jgi:hypothetical protein
MSIGSLHKFLAGSAYGNIRSKGEGRPFSHARIRAEGRTE